MTTTETSTRKNIERDVRRRFVLDAARKLIAKHGVENVAMDRIAAEAGYTRRTLYSYFKSHDEVLLLIHREYLAQRWAIQQEAVAKASTGLEKIIVWGESLFAYDRSHRAAMTMDVYWDFHGITKSRISPRVFTEFQELNDDLARGLREMFELGKTDHSLRSDLQVDICISQFIYSLRTIIHRALSPTYSFAKFDPDEYFHHYLQLFTTAICNREGAAT
jgi:TetR/AcrR family transcriptional regulator